MKGIGWVMIILGIGSLILPSMGVQFRLMEGSDTTISIVVAVIGLFLVIVAARRNQAKVDKAVGDILEEMAEKEQQTEPKPEQGTKKKKGVIEHPDGTWDCPECGKLNRASDSGCGYCSFPLGDKA